MTHSFPTLRSSDLQADHLGLVLQPIPDVGADIELVVEDAGPAGPVAVNRVLAPDAATGTARAALVEAGGDRLAGLALGILLENPHHDPCLGRGALALALDRVAGVIECSQSAVTIVASARVAPLSHPHTKSHVPPPPPRLRS